MVALTQKVLFLCNCHSTTLVPSLNHQNCCSGTSRTKEAEQGLPWSPSGGTMVATVIAQWTPFVSQRRHNGGTRKAEASLKLNTQSLQRYAFFYGATNGRPLCIHFTTTAMCVPSSCLLGATCERPTFSATFV